MAILLRVLILLITTLNPIIGTELNNTNSLKSVEELEYRPWTNNSTSTPWISLEGMGITKFSNLFRFNVRFVSDPEWLILDDNNIGTILPEAFRVLPNLTYLSLVGNNVHSLKPGTFSFLGKLQVLDLDGNGHLQNELKDTDVFASLTALKSLYLRSCFLTSFHLSAPMKSLSHLYLSSNALGTFHTKSESSLTHLYLDYNRLTFVSLVNFTSLIYLDVSGNWLHNIRANSQQSANYYARYVHRYSEDEGALYIERSPNLRHLIVSNNRLTDIEWDSFSETKSLIHVDLSNNKINQIRAGTFKNLLELESIILDSNQMMEINYRAFVNLPKVKIISLKNNWIQLIGEDAFTKLNSTANEVSLFLDNNNIYTLNNSSFKDIQGLKHIGLSNNRIKTISFNAFANLPNLESLVIEHQLPSFTGSSAAEGSIDSRAFFNLPNLTSLIIRGNMFADIAAEAFYALPKLRDLDLSNNSIEHLSPFAFSELPVLDTLKIGQNRLTKIEPGTYPKQLRILDLAENYPCPTLSCWNIDGNNTWLKQINISGIVEKFTIKDLGMLSENVEIAI